MEGVLWKWTNYWNGWQMRWFILRDGILSYYMSEEEVSQGCKGSMKVSALEITVNAVDGTRMDLSIPGEKNIYVRASSSSERQKWLVALGSSKQAAINNNTSIDAACNGKDVTETLRCKKSELRLYCDLLMQQVHLIRSGVAPSSSSEEPCPDSNHDGSNGTEAMDVRNSIDMKKLEEGSALLPATCDTFIKTLEECMKLSSVLISNTDPQHAFNNMSKPTIPHIVRTNSNEKKT